jgi:hypothetical protein
MENIVINISKLNEHPLHKILPIPELVYPELILCNKDYKHLTGYGYAVYS